MFKFSRTRAALVTATFAATTFSMQAVMGPAVAGAEAFEQSIIDEPAYTMTWRPETSIVDSVVAQELIESHDPCEDVVHIDIPSMLEEHPREQYVVEVPVEQEMPHEPQVPETPQEENPVPSEPETPADPQEPVEPEVPTVPEVPQEPVEPEVPAEPEVPTVTLPDPLPSTAPDLPSESGTPQEPASPTVPKPTVPTVPTVPTLPVPDVTIPAVPVPAVPATPEAQGTTPAPSEDTHLQVSNESPAIQPTSQVQQLAQTGSSTAVLVVALGLMVIGVASAVTARRKLAR